MRVITSRASGFTAASSAGAHREGSVAGCPMKRLFTKAPLAEEVLRIQDHLRPQVLVVRVLLHRERLLQAVQPVIPIEERVDRRIGESPRRSGPGGPAAG